MKRILSLIEKGKWREFPSIAQMSIEQIDNMRKTAEELEGLGISRVAEKKIN